MQDLELEMKETLITLTSDIVAAHVSNNDVAVGDVPSLITNVYAALANLGEKPVVEEPKPQPAVAIRNSIKPEYIVCLEDGKKLKMLKRYLRTKLQHDAGRISRALGPACRLSDGRPRLCRKSAAILAKKIGLGRKPGATRPARRTKKPA